MPQSWDETIIREIRDMGHEIGYHYDDLSFCKGDHEKAIRRFEKNLATLREIAPVKTICMGAWRHGGMGAWNPVRDDSPVA